MNLFAEPEISFRIKDDIDISNLSYSWTILKNLLDGILCSVEIVDFRFQKQLADIGAINLFFTNGASDYWIHNDKLYNIDEIDLTDFEVFFLLIISYKKKVIE